MATKLSWAKQVLREREAQQARDNHRLQTWEQLREALEAIHLMALRGPLGWSPTTVLATICARAQAALEAAGE